MENELELLKIAHESLEKQVNDLTYLLDKTRAERALAETQRDALKVEIERLTSLAKTT